MKNTYFNNKPRFIMILISIAFVTFSVRLLIPFNLGSSALEYIGIPFIVSLFLIAIRDPNEPTTWQKQYRNRIIDAFIIMFASSVVLFEGFVCVLMFMPIYLTVILLMFLIKSYYEYSKKKGKGTHHIQILPLLIIFSASEGINPELSFNRNEKTVVTRVVEKSISEIKNNLIKPIELQKQRPIFLALFPMPHNVKAGSLQQGDVHEIEFQYYRWFITNLHEGRMLLEISEVNENSIKTTFLDDTSYISNYVKLKGTEIKLDRLDEHHTRITLTIEYNRILDPYWYFAPIEHYAITKTSEFLITEVIAREKN